ncbi:MAG: squalene synthase HpnC [Acidobacteria bacterium]|nr:squalene synthase HpnC [Acidobacteriota bacterium]
MVPSDGSAPLARAYAACRALARSHYENFPVASRLLPPSMRPHVAAVYAFARVADDMADLGCAPAAERQSALAAWQRRLHDAVDRPPIDDPAAGRDDLMLGALAHSIRELDLPLELFDDLISAFGQDTTTDRYASWAGIFDYCRRSANPVGRLVLRIAGYRNQALDRSSDAVCTALQLTNFWQDFGLDWRAGRLYVPREVQDACGAREADLSEGRLTPAWAEAIACCVEVTRRQFDDGRAVCQAIGGRLGLELRATWVGGVLILDRVARGRADLLRIRPVLAKTDAPRLLWRAMRWKGAA